MPHDLELTDAADAEGGLREGAIRVLNELLSRRQDPAELLRWLEQGLGEPGCALDDSRVVALEGIAHQLTERKRAQAEKELYHRFFQGADNLMCVARPDGYLQMVNPAFNRSLGYSGQEMLSRPFIDFVHDDDRRNTLNAFATLLAGRPLFGFQNRYRSKNGEFRWLSWRARQGEDGLVFAVANDITEQKRTEEQLRLTSHRLQMATASGQMGVWEYQVEENKLVWDERMFEIYGLSRESFAGTIDSWSDSMHPEDRERTLAEVQAVLYGGDDHFNTDFRVIRPDRTVKHLKATALVLRNQQGAPVRMIGLNRDETELKLLEEQLRHSQKMEAIGTLAGGVAHDFNNILTAVSGYCSLIDRKTADNQEVKPYLDKLAASLERAATLTRSLLAYSRKQPITPRPVDLNVVLGRVDHLLSRLLREDIEMTVLPAAAPLMVLADSQQIEQVLMNLATNARDAMPDGGRLQVAASRVEVDANFLKTHGWGSTGSHALLTVSDSGCGMDEGTRQRIFEPFFTTKEPGKGTGLGLSIAYGIIKQHNGYLTVYSEPGQGSTFRIYLPLTGRQAQEEPPPPAARQCGGSETILLVEDDAEIRSSLKELLVEEGYRVLEAVDGEDGIASFLRHQSEIDLLLVDVIMPRKNGRELCRAVRAVAPEVRIIFMSGYTAEILSAKGVLSEEVHLVSKPVTIGALTAKIREVLDG